jgi:hypothetical protein
VDVKRACLTDSKILIKWLLFFNDLDRVDCCVIGDRDELKVEFALGGGLDIVENLENSAIAGAFFENIETLQKGCAVTIDVKDAAAWATR